MRLGRIVTPSLLAVAAACGKTPSGKDAGATAIKDTSQVVLDFKTLAARVKNADATKPTCPVIPHFEATLTLGHLSGQLTYRWERSTGKNSDTKTINIPAGAANGTVDLAIDSDEWLQSDRGVQQNPGNRVHVLSPLDRLSSPINVAAICY